jgi:hypothetical protein
MSADMYDLGACRPLSEAEIARCRRVASELAQLEGTSDTDTWVSTNGRVVHGSVSTIDFGHVDESFLNRLRHYSYMFSGYRLTNLLGLTSQPHWNDFFVKFFDPAKTAPDWSVPAFKEYVKGLDPQYVFSPPLIMGEVGFNVGGYCVNRDVVAYQERINLLREFGVFDHLRSKRAPLILEIGGGYGALAFFLKQRFPGAIYVVVDLPRSLLFSGCYLAAALAGVEVRVFKPGDRELTPGSVTLVADFLLPQLPASVVVDVAINTLSFAEMPEKTVADYCRWLEKHLAVDGILFEQNFDNRHFGAAHFCDPSAVLSRIFERRKRKTRGIWQRLRNKPGPLWGSANLWRKRAGARVPTS